MLVLMVLIDGVGGSSRVGGDVDVGGGGRW